MTTPMIALTREVGPALGECELSFVPRTVIDVGRARAQHHAYRDLLASLGCRVMTLPAAPQWPDAVFVEDVAVVLDEIAIMTRPGAASRRGEGAGVAAALGAYRPLHAIAAPATLDGGDVMRVGRTLYVGQGTRSNPEALAQLRAVLAGYGYQVHGVPTRDCLHLKSAVTPVADDTLLVQPRWVDPAAFAGLRLIEVDAGEAPAANALRIGATVVLPACFPRTRQRLAAAGIAVATVDVSELQKAEGAVTCCSLIFGASICAPTDAVSTSYST